MSDARKQSLAILAQIAEFLSRLPEDQLADLESGAARLTLIPAGSDRPLPLAGRPPRARAAKDPAPKPDVAELAQVLGTSDSREAAQALLRPLKNNELKELAAILGIQITGNPVKDRLVTIIVERTVGSRLDSLALRGTSTFRY